MTDEGADDSYNSNWILLSNRLESILHPDGKNKVSFEELYCIVYKNVLDGHSDRLHLDLITLCSKHLNRVNQKLLPWDEISVRHLQAMKDVLSSYIASAKVISTVFSYLNNLYVECHLKTSLLSQLLGLFCQIIGNKRLPTIIDIVQASYHHPFSILPDELFKLFNDLHEVSQGEYSVRYPQYFSKYLPNIMPKMKESDLEAHIAEVKALQLECNSDKLNDDTLPRGIKRPASGNGDGNDCDRKPNQSKSTMLPTMFH